MPACSGGRMPRRRWRCGSTICLTRFMRLAARHAAHRGIVAQCEILMARRAVIRRLRRWLYIGHRWIGIATCLLFAMWFVSGLVMMYVAFPTLTDGERLAALPDIAT